MTEQRPTPMFFGARSFPEPSKSALPDCRPAEWTVTSTRASGPSGRTISNAAPLQVFGVRDRKEAMSSGAPLPADTAFTVTEAMVPVPPLGSKLTVKVVPSG